MNMEKIPQFKKIYACVPIEVYSKLQAKGKFGNNFDEWLVKAIIKKLEEENENPNL